MDAVEEIKRRVDITEYVGRSVDLKRSGRNFRGLCPFHTERTPSFYVFPERGGWRCYGQCGEGGDIFTFVQKQQGIEFRDALVELAREANVELTPVNPQRRSRQERLVAVVEGAVSYYREQLAGEEGRAALTYLREARGITDATIETFGMGYAPGDWRRLRDHLATRGFSDADLLDAGVTVVGDGGGEPYDRFRDRVTIPIYDDRGAAIGIGGRALGDAQPKYLNSPQTEIFDKGHTLYGLNLAGDAAREAGEVVVVEGYMDVIGPWQAGFRNVVATMGTSLTEAHAKMLRRFAQRVILAMDPDSAGAAATERAGSVVLGIQTPDQAASSARAADTLAQRAEIELRVAPLPSGMDPDVLARESAELWKSTIAKALPFPVFLLERVLGSRQPASRLEARSLLDRIEPVLRSVRDPVERARYIQRIARRLNGIEEWEVVQLLRQPPRARRPSAPAPRRITSQEEYLLAIILRHPSLRFSVRNLPHDLFADSLNRELFRRWAAAESETLETTDDALAARLELIRGIRLPVLNSESARKAAREKIDAILRERLSMRQAALVADLAAAEQEFGINRMAELSADAWLGNPLSPEAEELAHMVIEELELGLSLHRHEAPELA